ncbi:phospholipase A2 inhibitor-like [Mercenaria mercenaria]|uniref:phospholipase A2 inhibitor-like n=1 Tax=Mercenaria mercenaria TaxID=6596 RepID=UPI00234EFD6B|nr:phospholipase A2 inhibitor-like [Mercenaria mercenaria]
MLVDDFNLENELDEYDIQKLSAEQANDIEGLLTYSELHETLKNMKRDKSPGCDGFTSEFFKVERDCRQGDPIPPYIFILCAEILAIKIRQNKDIKGIQIEGEEYKISQFADDTSILLDGTGRYLESATDQDLKHLDRCLLHEAFVLRIDINKCDMKKVPNGALTNIPHLLSIHFANNTISELEENAFQGLNEVTIIYLDGNELISLSPDAFMNIRTIDVLSMDNNDLQDIPYRAFRKSPIKYWHVANNRITEISSQIEKFPYLASLDIRNNNLRTTSKKLSRLHYLRELHISGNNLTTLPGALSNVLKRRNFNTHLGNNPWHCDCGIFWLITIVKEGFVKEELFCTTPQNISMDKVDTSGFDCKVDTGSVG